MIYLASPYYHEDHRIRELRYLLACEVAAKLMTSGDVVFSPIAHSHNLAPLLPSACVHSHEFWMKQDLGILLFCNCLYVLELPGVAQSRGVAEEIAFAKQHGISIEYLDPEEFLGNTNSRLIALRRLFSTSGHADLREGVE